MASRSNIYRPKLTGVLIAAILLVMVVVVILISTILIVFAGRSGGETTTAPTPAWTTPFVTPPTTTAPVTTTGDPNDPDDPAVPPPGTKTITVSRDEMNRGSLVLVDDTHFYLREGLIPYRDLTAMSAEALGFGALSASGSQYSLSKGNLFLDKEALAAFEKMTADLTAQVGNELQVRNAYYYDASVGAITSMGALESVEHSTGLVLDLQVYSNQKVYSMTDPKCPPDYHTWMLENSWKYGYIHVRDVSNYSTFRYVGIPHAAAIKKYGVDLAGYLQMVSTHDFTNRLKVSDSAGAEWWIYYVQALTSAVEVPVIGDETVYTISGDNMGGFVVAINSAVFAQ